MLQFVILLLITYITFIISECPSLSIKAYCLQFIDYNYDTECVDTQPAALKTLSLMVSAINNSTCRTNVAYLACSYAYKLPIFGLTGQALAATQQPCVDLCANVQNTCSGIDLAAAQVVMNDLLTVAQIYNPTATSPCADYGTPTCNPGPSAAAAVNVSYGRCEKYTGNVCKGISDVDFVYTAAGVNQASVEALLSSAFFLFPLAPRDNGCRDSLAKWLCTSSFPACDTSSSMAVSAFVSIPLVLPRSPCKSVCTDYNSNCASLLATFAGIAATAATSDPTTAANLACLSSTFTANCSSRAKVPPTFSCPSSGSYQTSAGFEDYPDSETVFSASPRIASTCFGNSTSAYSTNFVCPAPLVVPQESSSYTIPLSLSIPGGSCSVACKSFVIPLEHYDNADNVFFWISLISAIISVFLFATWVTFPEKRKMWLVLCLFFNLCMINLNFIFTFAVPGRNGFNPGYANINCKNNVDVYKQDDGGYCIMQGVFVLFFGLSACTFWFLNGLDIVIKILLKIDLTENQEFKKNIAYASFGWGLPLLSLIIALSMKTIGGQINTGVLFCFITDQRVAWGVFYYPIIIMAIFNTIFLGIILYTLAKSYSLVNTQQSPTFLIRPFLYLFLFLIDFGYTMIFTAYYYLRQDLMTTQSTDYVTCLLVLKPIAALQGNSLTCTAPTLNVDAWYILQFSSTAQVLYIGIIYLTSWDIYILWYNLLQPYFPWCCDARIDMQNLSNSRHSTHPNNSVNRPVSHNALSPQSNKPSVNKNMPMYTGNVEMVTSDRV